MAMSASMQSILARPMTNRTRLNQHFILQSAPCLRRNATLQVRCMAEEGQNEVEEQTTTPITTPPPSTQPTRSPAPKVSTKFSDVLAFDGPAPERINGRLAMVGFVAAMAVEVFKGEDMIAQIYNGGIPWFVGTSFVLTVASLIPLFRGVSVQSKSEGLMTSDAELWNGRFAMLGLVALALTEYLKGGALV